MENVIISSFAQLYCLLHQHHQGVYIVQLAGVFLEDAVYESKKLDLRCLSWLGLIHKQNLMEHVCYVVYKSRCITAGL